MFHRTREKRLYAGGTGGGYLLVAGAIARALAAPDPDMQAAKVAYEEQRFEPAGELLAKVQERRGDRPEIAFNQGLLAMAQDDDDSAKKLFERASESTQSELRASARFELGNLAFDAQDWDSAIADYIECLKARPLHEDAKWNLELALAKKQEQEKEKEKDKQKDQDGEQNEEEKNDDEKNEEKNNDDEKNEEEKNEEENKDENKDEENQDEQEQDASSGGQEGEDASSSEDQGEGSSTGGEGETSSEQGQDDATGSDQEDQSTDAKQDQQEPPPEPPQDQDAQQAPAAPAKSNLDRALEDLDREDPFMFGMPKGRRRRVKEDW